MISGFSGLPKFKLSVTASGRAPVGDQVAPGFRHRLLAALERVSLAVARRDVRRQREALRPIADAHDRGVAARLLYRIAEDQVVVLLPNPALGAEVRRGEQSFERVDERHRLRHFVRRQDRGTHQFAVRPLVERRLVAKLLDRQVGHDHTAVFHDKTLARRRLADDREIEPPLAEDRLGFRLLLGTQHHEHALLALREHHLVGAHSGLAARDLVEVEVDTEVALGAHLDGRAREAGRAHVLNGDDAVVGHDFEAGLKQQLFREWIADLNGRPLLLGVRAEFGGRHGGAVDAVAAGLGAQINHRLPDAGRGRIEDLADLDDPDRHGIDQAVAVVAGVEADGPADRRHAERVAVAADAGDHTGHQMTRARMRRVAEAQRIEAGDRPRAHGEDVAQDAADAGRRTLVRLDVARVVVALHLEHGREAVADRDYAGVLARPLDHPGGLRRQRSEMDP